MNLDGRGVKSSAYKLKVNYSQSTPAFPDFLSGRDMIDLFARLKRADLNQPDELINLFNVSSFINSSIETYSSGMLKKVSIVIAFLGNPDWIILDEPLLHLMSSLKKF